jgi:hypothetical protein
MLSPDTSFSRTTKISLIRFAIFAPMRIALKKSYLFLAFSLTLILADYDFIDNTFSHNHIITLNEYSNTSNHIEHSHSFYFEDDIFMKESIMKSNKFLTSNSLIPILKFYFTNSFIDNIWQPPRFS